MKNYFTITYKEFTNNDFNPDVWFFRDISGELCDKHYKSVGKFTDESVVIIDGSSDTDFVTATLLGHKPQSLFDCINNTRSSLFRYIHNDSFDLIRQEALPMLMMYGNRSSWDVDYDVIKNSFLVLNQLKTLNENEIILMLDETMPVIDYVYDFLHQLENTHKKGFKLTFSIVDSYVNDFDINQSNQAIRYLLEASLRNDLIVKETIFVFNSIVKLLNKENRSITSIEDIGISKDLIYEYMKKFGRALDVQYRSVAVDTVFNIKEFKESQTPFMMAYNYAMGFSNYDIQTIYEFVNDYDVYCDKFSLVMLPEQHRQVLHRVVRELDNTDDTYYSHDELERLKRKFMYVG